MDYVLVELKVLTMVVMNISFSWDITFCSLLKVNQYFAGKYHFRLKVLKSKAV
jgi:hypothetical protein